MSTVAYEVVDVFTDRPFTGNPLAVVFGAEQLGTDQMQTLAREFNLAETTFVLPPTDPGATYRVRIFTTETELPFAGHPSVGTAVTLMRQGRFGPGKVVQECGAGLLPLEVTAAGAATLTGAEPRLGDPVEAGVLIKIAGLTADDYAGDPIAVPRVAGCGLDWVFLPVRRSALADVRIDTQAAEKAGITELSVFSWADGTAHCRVFVPGTAVWEDPATGSAALGLGVWLVAAGRLPGDGVSSYRVHQGTEMKRPSVLDCTVTAVGGVATSATVTGHVQPVAAGTIMVPPFIG